MEGPKGGKLLRPSDGKEAKNVAFIQCAGSRDRNYLKHCSRICCMASLKQATYVRKIMIRRKPKSVPTLSAYRFLIRWRCALK